MNQEKETSFFKKIFMSIINPEKYPELASKKWGVVISYLVKLLAIFTIIASFCSVYIVSRKFGQSLDYIKENIPYFTFENNLLKVESQESIIIKGQDNLLENIILDTNMQIEEEKLNEYKENLKNVENGIILLNDRAIVKTVITDGFVEYSYSTIAQRYQIDQFNKQNLLDYFSGANLYMIYVGMFFITFIYMYILYFISIWLDIILLGIFGQVTAMLMRLRLRLSAMCKLAIHALTLPILLNALAIVLETFTGFKITYFEIMYIGIACIYIVAAVLMIKSDVIKSKQELAKIIEEQARVKEEIKRKEEEEKQKKEEQKREQEKEKQRKKEKQEEKDKNIGDEPQGENA